MVSVVAPVYRNADTLRELARRVAAAVGDHELILVEDACPDASAAVAETLPCVRVLHHDRNRGQNAAVLTGLRAARGDIVVVLDADLQDPPEAIESLLSALARHPNAEAAFALRRGRYESTLRLLESRLFKALARWRSQGRLPAGAGLFVALRRPLVDALIGRPHVAHVVSAIGAAGVPLTGVPVERAPSTRSSYTRAMRLRLAAQALRSR